MTSLSPRTPTIPTARRTATSRVVGAIGGLALALTLAACGSTGSAGSDQPGGMGGMSGMDHGSMNSSSSPSAPSTATGTAGDVMFAQMMIPHHQQAVEMADLALTKAQSPQVKKLAEQIKAAQSPEIATMNGWLTSWGVGATTGTSGTSGTSSTDGMNGMNGMSHGDGMMSAADMTSLKNASGASFDKLWLTMMIAHHEGAITMAKQVLGTTSDSAVTQLANSIVSGQTAEISTMRGLLG